MRLFRFAIHVAVLAVLVFLSPLVQSAQAVAVPRLTDLAVLEDKTAQETIASVSAMEPSRFKPLPTAGLFAGFTESVHWLRFTIDAPAGEWWLEVRPPYLEDLRFFEPDVAHPGVFLERRAGIRLPFSAREVPHRSILFKLNKPDDLPRVAYLRLATTSSFILIPRLWFPASLIVETSFEFGLLIASLTVLLTVLLVSSHRWFLLRDALTLWFLVFIAARVVSLLALSGLLQQYALPDWPTVSYYVSRTGGLCTIATFAVFYQHLFGINRRRPRLFWTFRAAFWLPLASIAVLPFGFAREVMAINLVNLQLLTLICTWLALQFWREKAVGGSMMFMAILITLAGLTGFVLNQYGVITGDFWVLSALSVSSLASTVALQLALNARYRQLDNEMRETEMKALTAVRDAQHERAIRAQQGKFLSMLSHELRTSLAVLRIAVDVQPMTPRAMGSADRAMLSMNEVIERSLQAEKLTDGALQGEHIRCDIAALLEAVCAASQHPARLRMAITCRPVVTTDARLLRVILSNLVDNALKYGPAQLPIDIALDLEQTAPDATAHIVLTVTNPVGRAGCPDPDQVFEKYYRAPRAHEQTGMGLGLFLARHMARLLDGELRYLPMADAVGFQLRLPAPSQLVSTETNHP